MPNAEAGTAPATIPDRSPHAREQQLRDAKQRAVPLPKRSERSDHEDILEGLEREYASAMAKLQAAHEREMLLSSRVGDLQKKLQARTCHTRSPWPATHYAQVAAEETSVLKLRETELTLSLQQTQVVLPPPPLWPRRWLTCRCRRRSPRRTFSSMLIWSNFALKQSTRFVLL